MAMYNGHIMRTVSATEYKNNALRLMTEAHESGETIYITKHGEVYAELRRSDMSKKPKRVFGAAASYCTIVGDLVEPVITPEEWGENYF